MDVDHSLNLTSLTVDNCLTVFSQLFRYSFALFFTFSITYQNSAVQHQILSFMLIGKSFITAK